MKRKVMVTAAALALAAMVISACTKEEQPQFTGEERQEPEYQSHLDAVSPSAYRNVQGLDLEPGTYISIIGKEESSAYSKELNRGVMQAAEDLNTLLGYTGSDRIKVVYNGAAKGEDIGEQVNILDEELSRYPDVLGIASVDEDACTVQLDLATSNGIPIIAFDSGNVHSGVLCTVKTDNVDAARTGAYKLADEIGGEGQVLLLVNDSESESARERTESFLQEMKENHPDIEVVKTIYLDDMVKYKKQIVEEKAALAGNETEDGAGQGSAQEDGETRPDGNMNATNPGNEGDAKSGDASGNEGDAKSGDASGNKSDAKSEGDLENEGSPADESAPGSEENLEESGSESPAGVTDEEKASMVASMSDEEKASMVASMSDEDVLVYYLEKYPDLKGMFGTSFLATQAGLKALRTAERTDSVALMGFDAGKEQLEALKNGEIKGLVVQNPFGMGYAAVVAAARTVLDLGNEAQVDTGYTWVTQENVEDASIREMLYE